MHLNIFDLLLFFIGGVEVGYAIRAIMEKLSK